MKKHHRLYGIPRMLWMSHAPEDGTGSQMLFKWRGYEEKGQGTVGRSVLTS